MFVIFLQTEEMTVERRIAQIERGAPAQKRNRTYVAVDEALNRLNHTYLAAGIPSVARMLQYMGVMAHRL